MLFYSIILTTYNSELCKIKKTIDSILQQTNVDFELIIADDGSNDNQFEQIKRFLLANDTCSVKYIANETNRGTVRNIISALNVAEGKYIKLISPGDILFDEMSLYKAKVIIESNPLSSVFFGNALFYNNSDSEIFTFKSKKNPVFIRPYIKQNYQAIKRNYLIEDDKILGAATIYHKEKILSYLQEISSFIKYSEDYSIILMLAKGEKVSFINIDKDNEDKNYFIWYEYGTGISTLNSNKWTNILRNELLALFNYMHKKGFISHIVFLCRFSKYKIIRVVLKVLIDPGFLLRKKKYVMNASGSRVN